MATKAFAGKDNPAEERKEAKLVRSGKVTPAQYAQREKAEGDKMSPASLKSMGKKLATGKMSAAQYAAKAKKR